MKRRPKKRNPLARVPSSRHKKEMCPFCDLEFHVSSLAGHVALTHRVSKGKRSAV